ncbi:MAG TPA: protein phosphatase 2C domain-containing protein [Nocardioidaceae bacterium]|jgi:protein phosphatase|nr:protein phosphatase 2C domain-containing protein [Nocardioidaceae bacterium]
MTVSLRYAALSDVGRVRKDNQDSGFASERLLVVADGVGGAARGDVASSTAVQILRRLDTPSDDDPLEALAGAIHRAHDRLAELVESDPELDGTSTTVTAALFDGNRLGIGHVGDSRGYLLRDGELSQLTKDHTFVQSLIDEGRITEEESRVHPHRNLILRAVDGVHETDPDLFYVELVPGDRILLCSDGCSGVLDADRLADILGTGTVDYAVVELVRASLEAGSSDNVTCVVADVVDADAPAAAGSSTEGRNETIAAATTGPMLVGAAAEQPRRAGATSKSFFRGHRSGDTGELEPVPGEGGRTGDRGDRDPDPEELRYAPRAPRRFVWLRRIAILVVLGVLVWLAGSMAYRWTQQQYYVAAQGETVAIYRGVQADVPGMTLTSVYQPTDVRLATLPDFRAEQVRGGIPADDLTDAKAIIQRLEGFVRICPTPTPTPTPTPEGKKKQGDNQGDKKNRDRPVTPSPTAGASDPAPTSSAGPTGGTPTADATGATTGATPAPATPSPTDCVEATP